jgi:uncharacterized membrane protein
MRLTPICNCQKYYLGQILQKYLLLRRTNVFRRKVVKPNQALLCSDVLGQEAELQLELLHQRDREVHGAPAFATFHGLEVVLVALAPAVVEHVAGAVRRLEVVP